MIFVIFTVALMTAGAVFAPDTPLGRWLRRALIEAPAAWLNEAGPLKLAIAVGVILLVMAAPELAVLSAADLGLFLEALAAVTALAAQTRVRKILEAAAQAVRSIRRRCAPRSRGPRPRASRPVRRPRPPPIEDEDAAWAGSPAYA